MTVQEGTLLWTPPAERAEASALRRSMGWLKESRGLRFDDGTPELLLFVAPAEDAAVDPPSGDCARRRKDG
ncbi:MAG: hypothetical protein KM312_12080 [Hydrogenibacillus schlegelii]|uniref:Uncharacterized protein n=1 Tax=Hydrogenibacillus schlegelii TaxID=1484 RepID=A0A947D5Y4_HYDSH|nr:hypothetical protein [Hydrogenibacillus schlegelii]